MVQGEFSSATMGQVQDAPTFIGRAQEYGRRVLDGGRAAALAGLLLVSACNGNDSEGVPTGSEVAAAAMADGASDELTCAPDKVDFSKKLADTEFGTPTSVFPNLGATKEDKENNIKTLQRITMGDERVAYSMTAVIDAFNVGISESENLTNAGLQKWADAFKANPDNAKALTAELCAGYETARFVPSKAAAIGGVRLVFNRDSNGVVSTEYQPFDANSTLDGSLQLVGNLDEGGISEQDRAKRERDVYVLPNGDVVVLGANSIPNGDAVLTDRGKEVKAKAEAEAAAAAAAAQAQAEAEAKAKTEAEAAEAAAQQQQQEQQKSGGNGGESQSDADEGNDDGTVSGGTGKGQSSGSTGGSSGAGGGSGVSQGNAGGNGTNGGSAGGTGGGSNGCGNGCGTGGGGGGSSTGGGSGGGSSSGGGNGGGSNGGGGGGTPSQPTQPKPTPPPTQPPTNPPTTPPSTPPKGVDPGCDTNINNPNCD